MNKLLLVVSLFAAATSFAAEDPTLAISQTLDHLHSAASKADGQAYFALFAPEGVFLGTDATERWTVEEFKKYAMPHFSKGKGWTYVSKARHIQLAPGGEIAWFDEILDNATYGTCRGSGVLRKVDGSWKISQYHLTIPVPNDLAEPVVKMIKDRASPSRE
jgi:hypothetical protein